MMEPRTEIYSLGWATDGGGSGMKFFKAPLIICQPLVYAPLDGISRRFGTIFDDVKAQLVAASSTY